ncbi:MAG: hypothetical protein CMN78_02815 [Spirochaetales bacterium]|nr:hypothetical protein [Spirochaetales bacterium]
MKERKAPLIVAATWQLIRFSIIGLCANLYFNPDLYAGRSVLVLWPAAPSLLLAAGLLIAGLIHRRFVAYRRLLILGKLLEAIPGLFLLVLQGGALHLGITRPVFEDVHFVEGLMQSRLRTEVAFYYLLAGVVLIDLIFLLILLSYKTESERQVPSLEENLPELTVIEIEEE